MPGGVTGKPAHVALRRGTVLGQWCGWGVTAHYFLMRTTSEAGAMVPSANAPWRQLILEGSIGQNGEMGVNMEVQSGRQFHQARSTQISMATMTWRKRDTVEEPPGSKAGPPSPDKYHPWCWESHCFWLQGREYHYRDYTPQCSCAKGLCLLNAPGLSAPSSRFVMGQCHDSMPWINVAK